MGCNPLYFHTFGSPEGGDLKPWIEIRTVTRPSFWSYIPQYPSFPRQFMKLRSRTTTAHGITSTHTRHETNISNNNNNNNKNSPNPKTRNVTQIKHPRKGRSNLANRRNAPPHCQKPNHRPRTRHWHANLMQIRSEQRCDKHGTGPQNATSAGGINARVHDHAIVFELAEGGHEGEEAGEYVVSGVHYLAMW